MKPATVILSASTFLGLGLAALGALLLMMGSAQGNQRVAQAETLAVMPTNTPQESLTPQPTQTPETRSTLRPAPTFQPATSTPIPLPTSQPSASATLGINVDLPRLHGLETATPTLDACTPRKDWGLSYTVKEGDAMARIAQAYGTYADDLAAGNCLSDANMIYVGQTLRVPGSAHPVTPEYTCQTWEVLTPMDWAYDIAESGQLTFNWRGSAGNRNLIRVFDANGAVFWERTVDMRQNETINLTQEGFTAGSYTWQVYPLRLDFSQIPCLESPLWHFNVGTRATAQPQIAP